MDHKITDDAVAELPLHHGRAELLEEIMSTPVLDDTPVRTPRSRRASTWLAPLAAAAAVAALATIPLWGAPSDQRPDAGPGAPAAQPDPAPSGDYVILEAAGWHVDGVAEDEYGGEIDYQHGNASLEIMSRPASLYREYVQDRRHIVEPPAPGDPVRVLGLAGQMWAYSADDHTVIREVENGHSLEFRGEGMGRQAFVDLLGGLRLVDLEEFEATLPDQFVTSGERAAVTQEIVDGIAGALGSERGLTPAGIPEPDFASDQPERYQIGADVAGKVACAWLDSYVAGVRSGDDARSSEAAAALATSRRWPILNEMDASGDYPEVVWEYADDLAAGRDPAGYQGALGCR